MMAARRFAALVLAVVLGMPALAGAQNVPSPPSGPPSASPADVQPAEMAVTPPRLSYLHGSVSFRRPGADDWTPAALNTPLAPGDALYTGQGGALEIQVGPQAFIRAAEGTQIALDNHDVHFIQVRVPAGAVAIDVGQLSPGATIEVDTPNGAFTLDQAGYYRVDVLREWAAIGVHRGGRARVMAVGGNETPITSGQQAVVRDDDGAGVELRAAPSLDAWDQWNQTRTAQLRQGESARYVGADVYGVQALDQHGSWHVEESYGRVWVPASVPAGWVPYSTGRWIWDSRFGWTWLDDAPWGWAPYHYGRWVFARSRWAWAPGPIVTRPVYAPALVVFLGGRTSGHPLYWAPLGWGEPVIPWWGRRGFAHVPTWAGWGGPRVVNNVVVNHTTVNVTNITVYRNVHVANAVVGVPAERFGRGETRHVRVNAAEVSQLRPVRGAPRVQPIAASVVPRRERGIAPPATVRSEVVAKRPPHDPTPSLRAVTPEPRVVPRAPARPDAAAVPPPHPRAAERATGAPAVTTPRRASQHGGPAVAPRGAARQDHRDQERSRR